MKEHRAIARTTRFPRAAGILPAVLAVCGCEPPSEPARPPPAKVQVVLPQRGEIARTVVLPAIRILAEQEATLYAKVSGYLKTIEVDKGDAVREGQLLAEIEVPEIVAEEARYRAEVEACEANYRRVSEARGKAPDLVVPQSVEDLRAAWEVAKANLQRTRTQLAYSRITAPFAGVITACFVDPGAFIPAATAGTPARTTALVTLMDASRVRVQVFVPEPEVPFIANGIPAEVTVEELRGHTYRGAVTRSARALDEATRTMLTEIEIANPSGELLPGMYAAVKLEVERKRDALLLPSRAVVVEKAGTSVFVVAGGKAKKTRVRTGFDDGVNVEIAGGVEPGQPVVLIGNGRLEDGQEVSPVEAR